MQHTNATNGAVGKRIRCMKRKNMTKNPSNKGNGEQIKKTWVLTAFWSITLDSSLAANILGFLLLSSLFFCNYLLNATTWNESRVNLFTASFDNHSSSFVVIIALTEWIRHTAKNTRWMGNSEGWKSDESDERVMKAASRFIQLRLPGIVTWEVWEIDKWDCEEVVGYR